MAKEIENKEMLNKFGGSEMSFKGEGRKLMGVMAMVMAINAVPAPTVQAAEMPLQQDNEIAQLQEFADNFNLTFTEANQKEMINAGYFIGDKLGKDNSDLEKVIDNTYTAYQGYLDKANISQRDLGVVDYAKAINIKYNVEDAPNYLLGSVDSPYPEMKDLSAEALNTIVAKAESLTQNLDEKPYHSIEEAYEFMQESYNTKIRYNGGADVYNEKGEWEDLSMDKTDVMKGFVDFASKGVTEEMKWELPNYLTSYDNEKPVQSIDNQMEDLHTELKHEANDYEGTTIKSAAKNNNKMKNSF